MHSATGRRRSGCSGNAGELRSAARVAIDLARLHVGMLGHDAAGQRLGRAGPDGCSTGSGRASSGATSSSPSWRATGPTSTTCWRAPSGRWTIAVEFGDSDLEAQALADGGLALVSQGRASEGFARLDAALAAISAGEVGPDRRRHLLLLDADRLRPGRRRAARRGVDGHRRGRSSATPATGRGCCTPTAASPTGRCCCAAGRWSRGRGADARGARTGRRVRTSPTGR